MAANPIVDLPGLVKKLQRNIDCHPPGMSSQLGGTNCCEIRSPKFTRSLLVP